MSLTIDNLPSPALIMNEQGNIVEVNSALTAITEYEASEILNQPIEFLLPEDLQKSHLTYRLAYQQNPQAMNACQYVDIETKSEKLIAINLRFSRINNHYLIVLNKHEHVISHCDPICSVESAKIFKGMNEPYWEWNIIEDSFFYSAKMMAYLGYKEESVIGHRDFWHKHLSANTLKEIYQQTELYLYHNGAPLDITAQLTTKQGEKKWFHLVGQLVEHRDGKPSCMLGTMKDVTEYKKLIGQLKKQNDYLMMAEKISNSGHWRYDFRDKSFFWSTETYRIYGVDKANFFPTLDKVLSFHAVEEPQLISKLIEQAKLNGQGFYHKGVVTRPSGKKIRIEITAEVEVDSTGEVIALFGICRDITKTETTLEKIKLLAMVNFTINVPIFFIDEKDNVVYQDLSPYQGGKASGLFNYVNFSITQYLDYKKQAKAQGQVKKKHVSFDNFNTVYDLSVTYESEEGIYIWIVENVTEQFRKDQQQAISNRLALLGNTFGNVSHDINNVLGVALGAIEMLELKFEKGEQDNFPTYIERVKNAIDKGKSVTERLLAFTRKPIINVVSFDPIEDIEKNKYLFQQLLLNTINLSFKHDNSQCTIRFPQGEFINILLNLVLNAQDAIQEQGLRGNIEISTKINEHKQLEIHVKDSGIGIEEENLTKIFDPFYSSKSINKGNGIGLANVFDTMYKHNGEIKVAGHCELGGAHFTLIFKCESLAKVANIKNSVEDQQGIEGKSILILDDEVSIGEFVALYLENHGAKTVCVHNKENLLNTLAKGEHFDVFITDMIMPDLSGQEAVNIVQSKYPDIKIYSMSGYIAEDDYKWDYPVLRKPFNSKELAQFLQS